MSQYPHTIQYQIKTESPPGAFPPIQQFTSWFQPLSEPVRIRQIATALTVAACALVQATFAEPTSVDKWFKQWQDPVRLKPGLQVARQPFYFAEPFGMTRPETVMESKWHQPWSEPVRLPKGLKVYLQSTTTGDTSVIPLTTIEPWFAPWSEPVRFKPRLITAANPAFFYGSIKPVVSFSYYNWLTEPVREKPGLKAALQQFFSIDWDLIPHPDEFEEGWYSWLSEPVRLPVGLKSYLQQFFTTPPRVLPTPDVTATMSATETNNDQFEGAIILYNPSDHARVAIKEIPVPGVDPYSIRES